MPSEAEKQLKQQLPDVAISAVQAFSNLKLFYIPQIHSSDTRVTRKSNQIADPRQDVFCVVFCVLMIRN